MPQHSQRTGTGEASTTPIMSHGAETNIFLNTAVHAGLMVLPLLLLTDSIFSLEIRVLLQSVLIPRLWLTARLVEIAMVETHQVFMNMPMNMVFLTLHVNKKYQKI